MLHNQTVEPETLELLEQLMQIKQFSELRLVGDTALALQIGHRLSVDIDLFGILEADEYELSKILLKIGTLTLLKKTKNINIYLINGIKVDIVNYHYPWLEDKILDSNIKMAGLKDIAAMKLAALTGRGSKKDFIDVYFLLKNFSLPEMLNFYDDKYVDGSEFLVLKSLTYFDDAEMEETPKMLKSINWETIKKVINKEVQRYIG